MPSYFTVMNVPEIRAKAREKHESFLKDYGRQVEKVTADRRLMIDTIFARIYSIVAGFKEDNIIDAYDIVEQIPLKKMCIQKNGYDSYINVVTNGEHIWLEGFDYSMHDFSSDVRLENKRFDNIYSEDFDWLVFSMELLDYIHSTIYRRKEAASVKIDNMFLDNSRP